MMSRVWRRIFNLLALMSLLLFAITLAFAVRSMWIWDAWDQRTSEMITVNSVHSNRGSIRIFLGNPQFLLGRGATEVKWEWWRGKANWAGTPYGLEPVLGVAYRALPAAGAVMLIPYWLVLVVSGGMPGVWGIRRWRRWRTKENVCAVCGYDLRASIGRCPECGSGEGR
jgi:hypothetical protein